MNAKLSVLLQRLLPQRLLCAFIYKISRAESAPIRWPLIHWFARQFAIDLNEAERSRLSDYRCLNDLFTRALAAGARPIDETAGSVVSPVDGRLTEFGRIERGQLLQAKGRIYALSELLGENTAATQEFAGGCFATIYLAPHNYHRIHAPMAGRWLRTNYIPGARFSVNRATTAALDNLFCRNERAVCWFDTGIGAVAVVLVGALNVSSIGTTVLGEIPSGRAAQWQHALEPVEKGGEIGRFNMGSTVVVLFPRDGVSLLDTLTSGDALEMGRPFATLAKR